MKKTLNQKIQPFVLTIFGASGDLAKLKIFPSLFDLARTGRLPQTYYIIGYARSARSTETFREEFAAAVRQHEKENWTKRDEHLLTEMLQHLSYFQGQYDDADSYAEYGTFRTALTEDKYDQEMFYFSVPPQVFAPIIKRIAEIPNLKKERVRLVIEKPFGSDEDSATQLFHLIGERFDDSQIYLLDHYLGKSAVRSILTLRHNNRLLNLMLKGREVANIQISALEPFGVENRLGYFDQVGTMRDMLQSHLLQILSLITMSIPVSFDPQSIRQEKGAILSALKFSPELGNVSIGQYAEYCNSTEMTCSPWTPTFGALRLKIDRESWFGVPIYLRSGKYIGNEKATYISIELKKFAFQGNEFPPNRIVLELGPGQKLHLKLYDEYGHGTSPTELATSQSIAPPDTMGEHAVLILDALRGDQTHFLSFQEIIACWRVMDEVIAYLDHARPERYDHHGDGPASQHALTRQDNTRWYPLSE